MQEGPGAYIEAIEFLQAQKPVAALKWAPELARAALDHVRDIGPKGLTVSLGSGMFLDLYLIVNRWFTTN